MKNQWVTHGETKSVRKTGKKQLEDSARIFKDLIVR